MNVNNDAPLSSIEIDPRSGETPAYTVIWLHGLGADGNDFVPIVPELNLPSTLPIRFVFPHAPIMPITINNGYEMRAWYDIKALSMDGISDEVGIAKSVKFVEALIKKENSKGIASKNILLGGFSQGAVIALIAGLTSQEQLAGIIAISGYLPFAAKVIAEGSLSNKQTPIFLAHGTEDPVVPFVLGQAVEASLKAAGYPVTWRTYPIPHTVNAEEIHDISQWMQTVLTKK